MLEILRRERQYFASLQGPLEERVHHLCWNAVADGRMGSAAVVVAFYEVDDGHLRLVSGSEALTVVHLVFKGCEERFCHGVVMAVTRAAAR